MKPRLLPLAPLSQVVFLEGYLQLVFQHEEFSILNRLSVSQSGATYRVGESGFCDSLVGLIGETVVDSASTESELLTLTFESGAVVSVFAQPDAPHTEAFIFSGAENLIVVEHNA